MHNEKSFRNDRNYYKQKFENLYKYDHMLEDFLHLKVELEKEIQGAIINYVSNKVKHSNIGSFGNYYFSFNVHNFDENIVEKIFRYRHFLEIYNQAYSFYNQYHSVINESKEKVQPLFSSSVSWFFKNSKVKNDSVETANILCDLEDSNYTLKIENFKFQYNKISSKDAYDSFSNHVDEYCAFLSDAFGIHLYSEEDPEEPSFTKFNNILVNAKNEKKQLNAIQDKIDLMVKNIEKKSHIFSRCRVRKSFR